MKLLVATAATVAAIGIAACAQDRFSEDERDGVNLSNAGPLPGSTENDDALCSDGVDNDGDTLVDCADSNCYPAFSPNAPTVCAVETESAIEAYCVDGLDNDDNGFTDCNDNDCKFNSPRCENDDAKCTDGIDNDGNGDIDCADDACRDSNEVTVCPGEDTDALCSDNMDNDMNGFTDCEDFSCSMNPMVTVCN